jgi:D-sedoheptulose 7-phosphate isomerase
MTAAPPRRDDLDLVLFDFDGVMTDNRVYVSSDGVEMVACNRADGWGLDLLRPTGLKFGIVSTETNLVVGARGKKLRIPVHQGIGDKREMVIRFTKELQVPLERTAFVGNDTNDLPALSIVGWPICPADAHPDVLSVARWILKTAGGGGIVRELADLLLGEARQTVGDTSHGGKTTVLEFAFDADLALTRAREVFTESARIKQAVAEGHEIKVLPEMASRISRAIMGGGKLMLCGNGGSAADAQHLAAELLVRLRPHMNRDAVGAIALAPDASTITACGNDFGFEMLFERMVMALARPGDVLLGISTSGRSKNVIRALDAARKLGCFNIGFLGCENPPALQSCDLAFVVPSCDTGRIQESHITAGHALMEMIEDCLLANGHIQQLPVS